MADRRSNRTNGGNARDQQRDQEYCPSRERSRSRDNQVARSRTATPLVAPRRFYSGHYRRDTMNVRRSTTSMFDRLRQAGIN
ncbi:hypothetical protein TIFTF001_036156 [Ficus carica]|uniref:Uncharacterized protein n=1 Tax=Ficus carica TaxID=3494 RepID=A0AA88JAS6_FICCA|nr:hypothetical protein TIFTF001_036125 [Ficus carica]GMN67083.1 hypothetical protein TIFTF001_036151 [Ficus carica]GMN67096.1 hypothetical protein TIFTF001_036156 [Ficus carica]